MPLGHKIDEKTKARIIELCKVVSTEAVAERLGLCADVVRKIKRESKK